MALDVGASSGLTLFDPVAEGARNEVWIGDLDGRRVAVRRSRRAADPLAWELGLLVELNRRGFRVPVPIGTDARHLSAGGVVVQPWVVGRAPVGADDWRAVAAVLRALHGTGVDIGQRPGCRVATALDATSTSLDADPTGLPLDVTERLLAVFSEVVDAPVSLIHGDPGPSNIRVDDDGAVWLLDWDERRVDVTWHDLSNLVVRVLDREQQRRAQRLSYAWEAANAWTLEPDHARMRLARLVR